MNPRRRAEHPIDSRSTGTGRAEGAAPNIVWDNLAIFQMTMPVHAAITEEENGKTPTDVNLSTRITISTEVKEADAEP